MFIGAMCVYGQSDHIREFTPDSKVQEKLANIPEAVIVSANENLPRIISGNLGKINIDSLRRPSEIKESQAFKSAAEVFGIEPADLVLRKSVKGPLGATHVSHDIWINGLQVVGAELKVHIKNDGEIYMMSAPGLRSKEVPQRNRVSLDLAKTRAESFYKLSAKNDTESQLVYVYESDSGGLVLCHEVILMDDRLEGLPSSKVYINAISGDIVTAYSLIHSAKNRTVRDANFANNIAGTIKRSEGGGASGISYVDTNYDDMGYTYDYYNTKFGRDSLDGSGLALSANVNFRFTGSPYQNAAWLGTPYNVMIYGEGSGSYNNWAISQEVTAHEMQHGVTSKESNLLYVQESGAINESMSDIAGASVDAYAIGSIPSSVWKIGEDILTAGFRNMSDPNAHGDIDYYGNILTLATNVVPQPSNDWGYVHSNSGIGNLAFYLMVDGGTHPRSGTGGIPTTSVPSIGLSEAEAIFYRANTVYLGMGAQYMDLRAATIQAASDLYGSPTNTRVAIAWDVVGVPTFVNRNPVNISTRAFVGSANMVAGFVLNGSGTDSTLIRAVGPTLGTYGVTGAISDPQVTLVSGGSTIASNDNWHLAGNWSSIQSTASTVGAFPLPNPSNDAAILTTLGSGVYTATVSGVSGVTGIGLVEVYDANGSNSLFLKNISTRAEVKSTAKPVAGFVINGSGNKTLLLRGVGVSTGLPTVISDPQIKLFSGATQIRSNNSWKTDEASNSQKSKIIAAQTAVGAFSLTSNSESALLVTLPVGAYTVELSDLGGGTGKVGMIEVYVVD